MRIRNLQRDHVYRAIVNPATKLGLPYKYFFLLIAVSSQPMMLPFMSFPTKLLFCGIIYIVLYIIGKVLTDKDVFWIDIYYIKMTHFSGFGDHRNTKQWNGVTYAP